MLRTAYDQISEIIPPEWLPEPFKTVEAVHRQRLNWKPDDINVIIFAESHIYTSNTPSFSCPFTDQKDQFTRFIYCSAYGESGLLAIEDRPNRNNGTPQYWKLFYSCCHGNHDTPGFFNPILKCTEQNLRIANKRDTLEIMKALGIWLVDASIVAAYRPPEVGNPERQRLAPALLRQCIKISFEQVIRPLLEKVAGMTIVPVGNNINTYLASQFQALQHEGALIAEALPQPNRRGMSHQDWLKYYERMFYTCNPP